MRHRLTRRDPAALPAPGPQGSRPGDRGADRRPHRARWTLAHRAVHTPGGGRAGPARSLDYHRLDAWQRSWQQPASVAGDLGLRCRRCDTPGPATNGAHHLAGTAHPPAPAPSPPTALQLIPAGRGDRPTPHLGAILTATVTPSSDAAAGIALPTTTDPLRAADEYRPACGAERCVDDRRVALSAQPSRPIRALHGAGPSALLSTQTREDAPPPCCRAKAGLRADAAEVRTPSRWGQAKPSSS